MRWRAVKNLDFVQLQARIFSFLGFMLPGQPLRLKPRAEVQGKATETMWRVRLSWGEREREDQLPEASTKNPPADLATLPSQLESLVQAMLKPMKKPAEQKCNAYTLCEVVP